jgi:WD40 repeat protein
VFFTHRTDFIITGSCDGHIKFWKKLEELIEFVKHFRSHLGAIQDLAANSSGTFLCSISNDKSLKVFDVINFGKVTSCKLYTAVEIQILQRNLACLQVYFNKNCILLLELKHHRNLSCL